MLSIFGTSGAQVEEDRLRKWLQYLIKDKAKLMIKGAALVHDNGNVAAATDFFIVRKTEFTEIKHVYSHPDVDSFPFRGVTYCLRTRNTSQIIAFNGQHYIIVNKVGHIYLLVYCYSKQKVADVARWATKVANKLEQRGVAQSRT